MLSRSIVLLAAAISVAFANEATAGVLVAFRDKATVERSLVTLGDVADVRAAAPADVQRLSAVILGPAPPVGRESPFTFETIRSRLMSAGVDLAEVEFSGPASVTVSGAKLPAEKTTASAMPREAPVAITRIEQVVAQAIKRHLTVQSRGGSYEVSVNVSDEIAGVLASAETRGVDVSGGQRPWIGEQTFVLKVLDAAEQIREVRITCQVSSRPSILAAKHALPRGHVIGADDLIWRKAENEAESACVTDPKELLGRETQQPLRTGQAIAVDGVKTLPLIRNGQFVTVSSRRPGLAVQRVMKARGDGAFGEVISLQTLEDHKTILARVTGLLEADVVDTANDPPGVARIQTQVPTPIHTEMIVPISHAAKVSEPAIPMLSDTPRVHVNPTQALSVPSSVEARSP